MLISVYRTFQAVKRGEPFAEDDFDILLNKRGFLSRIFRPLFRLVTKSWHMLAIGFLFGLGFDTATEVALFGISSAQAANGMSFGSIMVFPAAVHRRHDAHRHDRRRADARRLWLGVHEADPQALLQHDHHRGLGGRRGR